MELAHTFDGCDIELLPIGLPFAPLQLLQCTREHHRASDNDCTVIADLPSAFAPQIYARSGLQTIANLSPANFAGQPAELLMHLLRVQQQSQGEQFIRAVPFLAARHFGLRPADIPFDFSLAGPQDVILLREAVKDCSAPVAFKGGEGLVRLKARLIDRNEATRKVALHLNRSTKSEYPRKVLFVSNASAFSGAEDVLCTIYENLDPQRFNASALIGMPGHLASRLQHTGNPIIIAGKDFSLSSIENLRIASDALNTLKPDIVHCNGLIGFPLWRH